MKTCTCMSILCLCNMYITYGKEVDCRKYRLAYGIVPNIQTPYTLSFTHQGVNYISIDWREFYTYDPDNFRIRITIMRKGHLKVGLQCILTLGRAFIIHNHCSGERHHEYARLYSHDTCFLQPCPGYALPASLASYSGGVSGSIRLM